MADITAGRHPPVFQSRAQYDRAYFAAIPPPGESRRPFNVFFAGRMERAKGIFQIVDMAAELERRRPGEFRFRLCGGGSDLELLRAAVHDHAVKHIVDVPRPCDRQAMLEAFAWSHALIVPTTPQFSEGLNRVVIEGMLARRPVVASRLANASDVLGDAILTVEADDVPGYVLAIERLADEPALYARLQAAGEGLSTQFYDRTQSWGAAIKRALVTARVIQADQRPSSS